MKKTQTAGGVVINDEGLVLVVNQKGTSWSLPKGHVEIDEDKLTTAKREIFEESGIKDLKLIKELGSYTRSRIGANGKNDTSEMKEITMFLFKSSQKDLKPQDPENPEARWVPKEEVAALLTHSKDKKFFMGIVKELNQV
jgi:ADP-ribose pyrophosphatase YjhB (NUDIX family)